MAIYNFKALASGLESSSCIEINIFPSSFIAIGTLGGEIESCPIEFVLLPERINYSVTEAGLEINIELGAVLPRLAGILAYIEYRLSLLNS
jgi:hypothetical protein